MKTFFRLLLILLVLAGIAWGATSFFHKDDANANLYRTVEIKRGDLIPTINATGTLEPEESIDVGAQVAGQIISFGKDVDGNIVDHRSVVKQGMLLAKIDDSLYQADLATAQAQLEQANAGLQHSVAELAEMQATLDQDQANWERAQKAGVGNGVLSQEVYDQYKAAYEVAKANIGVGQADIESAKGTVAQAQAAVKRAQQNVDYCTITSPVDGEIIDRRVNIGQTVVSSLNTPSLFLIAKDLHKMKVWASVNEADIGSIQPGQTADYTVDAFPNRTFHGTVTKVWLNASMTQNVVTYTVEISADNSDGKLLPYMTANINFEVAHEHNVLLVPNAALRYTPADSEIAPDARNSESTDQTRGESNAEAGAEAAAAVNPTHTPSTHPSHSASSAGNTPHEHGTLWERDGQYVRPIRVRVGQSDGTNTEVVSPDLKEGTEIVLADISPSEASSQAHNPFIPQFGNRHRNANSGGGGGSHGG